MNIEYIFFDIDLPLVDYSGAVNKTVTNFIQEDSILSSISIQEFLAIWNTLRSRYIAPRVVDTDVWSNVSDSQRTELAKWGQESLPVQHLGQPEELDHAVLSLMVNTYVTGLFCL